MAKIWQISDGRSYVVNGDPGTTITYTNSTSNGTAAGKQAASVPVGATSVTFSSNGSEVEISSDTATIDQVFSVVTECSESSSGGGGSPGGSTGGVTFKIVTTLPSQGAAGVIYLVKVSTTGNDKFEEWIWVDSAWESIGTTAVDPTTYAKLIGGNTFEGNQVINGDLTVTGDVSGVTESNYNVVETAETTITPTGGTWVRYTGTATSLTVVEPGWDGEAEISYLETATPVDLQGVTWSPAKPILTGNGPFVYALVHAGPGQMLAGSCGYSVVTAEAIQEAAPISWDETSVTFGEGAINQSANSVIIGASSSTAAYYDVVGIGKGTYVVIESVAVGSGAKGYGRGTAVGFGATANQYSVAVGKGATAYLHGISIGAGATASNSRTLAVGEGTIATPDTSMTIGCAFSDTAGSYTCQTQGTGSITIGAGANTFNSTKTVNGVETTVESSNSITIGCKASNSGADSVVIGAQASNTGSGAVLIGGKNVGNGSTILVGNNINANSYNSVISMGFDNIIGGSLVVAIGRDIQYTKQNAVCVGHYTSAALGSVALGDRASAYAADRTIAIGSPAKITNTGSTPSENTIVIGTNATASAPNSVVMGAGASASGTGGAVAVGTTATANNQGVAIGLQANGGSEGVAIGSNAKINYFTGVAIGKNAQSNFLNYAIGMQSAADGYGSISLGTSAYSKGNSSVAIGRRARVADEGVVVLSATPEYSGPTIKTQFYFVCADTPLAKATYPVYDGEEVIGGEAFMGYVVTDANGSKIAAGTNRLSVLFPDNSTFQPATLGLDDEMTPPKVFHPSDLDLPVEEPTEEPEDITINIPEPNLPEPNLPEPEPYTPLPVYPIVEPEVPEIVEEPTK